MVTVACITCERFSLRARPGDDEALREAVPNYAATGWGRCELDGLSRRFLPGQTSRECTTHIPLAADKVGARIEWVEAQTKKEQA